MENEIKLKVIKELAELINRNSLENDSNTPDFVLADYLFSCLQNWNYTTRWRDNWYGGKRSILDSDKNKLWETNSGHPAQP